MKRGDIVLGDGPGDYSSKRRPFLIFQSDIFNETHASFSVCPITSFLTGAGLFRLPLTPSAENGLERESEIEIDKVQTLRRTRLREKIGELPTVQMEAASDALRR